MTQRFPAVTGPELVKALKLAGYTEGRWKGSYLHLYRRADARRVTVPVHKGRMVPIGTLRAILKDADLTADDLRKLL